MKKCVQCNAVSAKRIEVQFKGDGLRTVFCSDRCLVAYRESETLAVIEAVWDVNEDSVAFLRPTYGDMLRCPVSAIDGNGIRHQCKKEKSHEKEHFFLCGHAMTSVNLSCELEHGHDGWHQSGNASWLAGDSAPNIIPEVVGAIKIVETLEERQYPHYFKDVSNYNVIDIYRVLALWGVTDPCIQHAIKKLLCAGQRGGKDVSEDIREAIASCNRWLEMRDEDVKANRS